MKPAIQVENLSKQYCIGAGNSNAGNLSVREALGDALRSPIRRVRRRWRRADDAGDGRIWALKDLSFEVQPGEALGIIGRNGAGKSTLLKILSRISKPTSGRIHVRGRVASLLEVGTGFHPDLSGRENVFLNGAILGMKRTEIMRKFDSIVAFSEVEKFLDTPVKHYSSGMYMRLAFAVTAHLEADILLMDEVLAVGDGPFREKCLAKMDEITRQGHTVLFVSHDLSSMTKICTRGLLLNQGMKLCEGSTREVLDAYMGDIKVTKSQWSCSNMETAPGTDRIRLRAVRVVSDGKVTTEVNIHRSVQIEIEYWNLQPEAIITPRIHVMDGDEFVIFTGSNVPEANLLTDEWADKPQRTGIYRVVCTLPADFFNEGFFRVGLTLLSNMTHVEMSVPRIVSFNVYDDALDSKDWPGVLRPQLEWQTQYLGAGE